MPDTDWIDRVARRIVAHIGRAFFPLVMQRSARGLHAECHAATSGSRDIARLPHDDGRACDFIAIKGAITIMVNRQRQAHAGQHASEGDAVAARDGSEQRSARDTATGGFVIAVVGRAGGKQQRALLPSDQTAHDQIAITRCGSGWSRRLWRPDEPSMSSSKPSPPRSPPTSRRPAWGSP